MKITFFGTSHGRMQKDRHCSCTLIESGCKKYIIDAGAPVADLLTFYGIPFDSIDSVFITHMHGDHVNGLIGYVDLLLWAYKDADPLLCFPENGSYERMESWLSILHDGKMPKTIRHRIIDKGEFFNDGTITVKAIPNGHLEQAGRPSFSFLIREKNKNVLFTGDLKRDLSDIPKEAFDTETDLILCEGAHNRIMQHIDVLKNANTKMFGFVHVNPAANSEEDINQFAEKVKFPVRHFSDGDVIEL